MEQNGPEQLVTSDTAETHTDGSLESLRSSARRIVEKAAERWPYAPGDTVTYTNPDRHDDPTAWRRVWLMHRKGHVLVCRVFDKESHIGSFPEPGVEGGLHHLKVVQSVGTPVPGDAGKWITEQLSILRYGVEREPQYCEVTLD